MRLRIWLGSFVVAGLLNAAPVLGAAPFGSPEVVFGYPGQGGDVGQYASLKHDFAGNLHVAYYEATHGDLRYAFGARDPLTGVVAWSIQTVDGAGDVGRYCRLAFTLDGRPVISYHDATHRTLKVAFDENGDGDFEQDATIPGRNDITGFYEIQTVDSSSPNTGLWISIVVDDDNHFHVSYKDQTHGYLRYAFYDGTSWLTETVDASPQVGDYTSIVVDNRQAVNVPYIFYHDERNLDLRAMRRLGGAWFPVPPVGPIDSASDVGLFTSAVITPANDRIYVSYQDAVPDAPFRADLRMAIIDELAPPTTELVQSCAASSIVPCSLQVLTGDFGYYSSIALDGSGLPVIAHYDKFQGDLLIERRRTTNFAMTGEQPQDIWGLKLRPETSGNVGLFPSVDQFTYTDPFTMTEVDVLHVASYDQSRKLLRLSTVTGGEATTATAGNIDGAKAGEFSSLALDPSGTPVVAYYDTVRGSLFLARRDGPPTSPWGNPMLVDNSDSYRLEGLLEITDPKLSPFNFQQSGQYVSMVMDPVGTAHLAYHDALRHQFRYATVGPATATNFFSVDPGPLRGEYASQAISADGSTFAIAYFQALDSRPSPILDAIGNGPRLRVAIGDGAANWTVESVDNAGSVGKHGSITFDAAGGLHVAYFDETNYNLKYAHRVGTAWQIQTVDDNFDLDGQYTSIAINPIGQQPAISYYDLSNSALKFAQLSGAQWVITTVDDPGNVGLYSKLRFDPVLGFGYIVYYDLSNGALKVAAKPAALNEFTLVTQADGGGVKDVGVRPSVVLDSLGLLHITYFDVGQGDLLYSRGSAVLLNGAGPSWKLYK